MTIIVIFPLRLILINHNVNEIIFITYLEKGDIFGEKVRQSQSNSNCPILKAYNFR